MTRKRPVTTPPEAPAPTKPPRGRRLARSLARSTAIAAGIAASHFGFPETDPRFPMFNPGLLDRLNAPITRYHE
jgi:hypothetical protein